LRLMAEPFTGKLNRQIRLHTTSLIHLDFDRNLFYVQRGTAETRGFSDHLHRDGKADIDVS